MRNPVSGKGIEAIAVKRATLADADKVRYRVYRSDDDFIAVIAESALMAMKVSGISNPLRIVRDLPTEGVAVEAQRIAKEATAKHVMLPVEKKAEAKLKIEIAEAATPADKGFVPMVVKDFGAKRSNFVRVLSPEMVAQLQAAAPAAVQAPVAPAPAAPEPVMPAPEPVAMEMAPPEPTHVEFPSAPESHPEPEPASAPAPAMQPPAPPTAPGVLSEEEVQQLLNG